MKNKNQKAFTLIEVLIAIAIFGIASVAFMRVIFSLRRKSIEIEMDTYANSSAVDVIGSIRSLPITDWGNIPITSTHTCYKYNSNGGPYFDIATKVSCSEFTDAEEVREFCASNSDVCLQTGSSLGLRANSDIFYQVVSIETLAVIGFDPEDNPRLVKVYIASSDDYDIFIKLSTIISSPGASE